MERTLPGAEAKVHGGEHIVTMCVLWSGASYKVENTIITWKCACGTNCYIDLESWGLRPSKCVLKNLKGIRYSPQFFNQESRESSCDLWMIGSQNHAEVHMNCKFIGLHPEKLHHNLHFLIRCPGVFIYVYVVYIIFQIFEKVLSRSVVLDFTYKFLFYIIWGGTLGSNQSLLLALILGITLSKLRKPCWVLGDPSQGNMCKARTVHPIFSLHPLSYLHLQNNFPTLNTLENLSLLGDTVILTLKSAYYLNLETPEKKSFLFFPLNIF